MKWRGRRGSSNIDDRRGAGGGFGGGGLGGLGGLRGGRGGRVGRIGGLGLVAVVVIAMLLGVDPTMLLTGGGGGVQTSQAPTGPNRIDDEREEFVSVVLADTEEVWTSIFRDVGRDYRAPTLVLFSGSTASACGAASAATGPFYCPPDKRIFLDMDFFSTLERRLGATGDFAQAYVIAHEVGHHAQNELGILPEVNSLRAGASETDSNQLSVRLELQADCFSGVWAQRAEARFGALEPGDIEEALNAASKIGDDRLQEAAGGRVTPDSFTHGSSAQRVQWFRNGYESGAITACDTFTAKTL